MSTETRIRPLTRSSDAVGAATRLQPRLAGRAAQHDLAGKFPEADFEDIREAGLLGLMVPTRLGGTGATFADYVDVAMALAAGNGATALVYNMHTSITGALSHTSDELARTLGASDEYFVARDRFLSLAVNGELFAVAMSERATGSRLSQVKTTYERVGDRYRIEGSKAFVSGAGFASHYLVAARTKATGPPEVSYFLVPASDDIVIDETWDSMGMRATGSQDIHIDTTVDKDALLGAMEGLTVPLASIMPQWLVASYAAVYVGVAQSAVDAAVAHVKDRSLTNLAAVRARIGRADARVAATRLCIREAARRVDRAPADPETNRWVYRAKLLAGDTASEVASSMVEAAGTSATRRGCPLERIFRDARCGALQPATSDVCADWLGTAALGQQPDSDADVPRW